MRRKWDNPNACQSALCGGKELAATPAHRRLHSSGSTAGAKPARLGTHKGPFAKPEQAGSEDREAILTPLEAGAKAKDKPTACPGSAPSGVSGTGHLEPEMFLQRERQDQSQSLAALTAAAHTPPSAALLAPSGHMFHSEDTSSRVPTRQEKLV